VGEKKIPLPVIVPLDDLCDEDGRFESISRLQDRVMSNFRFWLQMYKQEIDLPVSGLIASANR